MKNLTNLLLLFIVCSCSSSYLDSVVDVELIDKEHLMVKVSFKNNTSRYLYYWGNPSLGPREYYEDGLKMKSGDTICIVMPYSDAYYVRDNDTIIISAYLHNKYRYYNDILIDYQSPPTPIEEEIERSLFYDNALYQLCVDNNIDIESISNTDVAQDVIIIGPYENKVIEVDFSYLLGSKEKYSIQYNNIVTKKSEKVQFLEDIGYSLCENCRASNIVVFSTY